MNWKNSFRNSSFTLSFIKELHKLVVLNVKLNPTKLNFLSSNFKLLTVSATSGPITSAQMGFMPVPKIVPTSSISSSDTTDSLAMSLPLPQLPGQSQSKKMFESRGMATTNLSSKHVSIKESLVSVLIKLHTKLAGSARSVIDGHMTLRKIAIWMSKNCQKPWFFSKKLTKIVIFLKKMLKFWQFLDIQMAIIRRVRLG